MVYHVLLAILLTLAAIFFGAAFGINCVNGEYKKGLINYSIYFVLAIFAYGFWNIL